MAVPRGVHMARATGADVGVRQEDTAHHSSALFDPAQDCSHRQATVKEDEGNIPHRHEVLCVIRAVVYSNNKAGGSPQGQGEQQPRAGGTVPGNCNGTGDWPGNSQFLGALHLLCHQSSVAAKPRKPFNNPR